MQIPSEKIPERAHNYWLASRQLQDEEFGMKLSILGGLAVTIATISWNDAASAASVTVGSQNFGDVNTASATEVTYGGNGIPTDPVAWSEFISAEGTLILGLGSHGRYDNPDQDSVNGVYEAVAGVNDGGSVNNGSGATWNFNWFVEFIPAGNSTTTLADLGVNLLYDFDPDADTPESEHGVIPLSSFAAQGADPLVSQSSQNATFGWLQTGSGFLLTTPNNSFDPFAAGEYTFALQSNLGNVGIQVNVSPVPLPAAAWLFLSAIGGMFGVKRWGRKKSAATVTA
jgi:hypothetical protein